MPTGAQLTRPSTCTAIASVSFEAELRQSNTLAAAGTDHANAAGRTVAPGTTIRRNHAAAIGIEKPIGPDGSKTTVSTAPMSWTTGSLIFTLLTASSL